MLNPKSRMVIFTVERCKGMVWGRAHAGNKLQTVWGSELVGVQKRKERRKWGRKIGERALDVGEHWPGGRLAPSHLAVRVHPLIHRVGIVVEAEVIPHHRFPLLQGPGVPLLQGHFSRTPCRTQLL